MARRSTLREFSPNVCCILLGLMRAIPIGRTAALGKTFNPLRAETCGPRKTAIGQLRTFAHPFTRTFERRVRFTHRTFRYRLDPASRWRLRRAVTETRHQRIATIEPDWRWTRLGQFAPIRSSPRKHCLRNAFVADPKKIDVVSKRFRLIDERSCRGCGLLDQRGILLGHLVHL